MDELFIGILKDPFITVFRNKPWFFWGRTSVNTEIGKKNSITIAYFIKAYQFY
jgi:hypothetical protein